MNQNELRIRDYTQYLIAMRRKVLERQTREIRTIVDLYMKDIKTLDGTIKPKPFTEYVRILTDLERHLLEVLSTPKTLEIQVAEKNLQREAQKGKDLAISLMLRIASENERLKRGGDKNRR